jgi:hypothetical protein
MRFLHAAIANQKASSKGPQNTLNFTNFAAESQPDACALHNAIFG